MRLFRLLTLTLFAISPLPLHAQLGLYGNFTVLNLGVPDNNGYVLYGGTFGAYLASGRLAVLSAGIDLRGSFATSGGTSFDSAAIGPRIGLNLHVIPIQPYVEATAGVGHIDFEGGSPNDTTKFEYQFLGGVDFTILPRVDWRVAEFSYGGLSVLNNVSFHPKSLSTGIVLRLPHFFPIP